GWKRAVGTFRGDYVTNGISRDAQVLPRAVVTLPQNADGVATILLAELPRGSADAAFVAVANHSGAAADCTFFDAATRCGINGVKGVLRFDVEAVDVVEPAVPSFRDNGQRPPVPLRVRLSVRDAPLNHGVANDADAMRVGDHHGSLEQTGFFDPGRSGHFAISIEGPPSGKDGRAHGIFPARKHR